MAAQGHGQGHVYEWLRQRRYYVSRRPDDPAASGRVTHLMMDGGVAAVPRDAHGAFLNAYAASLVRCRDSPPCLVELRTDVFKMFVDLDTRFLDAGAAAEAGRDLAGVRGLLERVAALVDPEAEMLVCASSRAKQEGAVCKQGFHLVWPDVLVRAPAALRLRDRLVQELPAPETFGLAGVWDAIVDASVYRANGLRMPWSAKGRHDDRVYELRYAWRDGEMRPETPTTVSALRAAVHRLSIRTFDREPTVVAAADGDVDAETGAQAGAQAGAHGVLRGGAAVSTSLTAYADVLPALAAALPIEFLGQRFTASVTIGESSGTFVLRSTARYCFNLGRAHRTNNVYFVLTPRGVHQRCYCRCETAEGRRYGMCKDFASEVWPVPAEVVTAFFGEGVSEGDDRPPPRRMPATVAPMPSRASKSLNLDSLLARSRATKRKKGG